MLSILNQKQEAEIMPVTDILSRPMKDLRISLTDRCNFRCRYCMPEKAGHTYEFLPRSDILSFEEITRVIDSAVRLGVTKIRFTGGEPLLRSDLNSLLSKIKSRHPHLALALTTNGFLLARLASTLKSAGLDRLTVSLDSLDNQIFRHMNGGKADVERILLGIAAAQAAGFVDLKINATIQAGINSQSIVPLARHFRGTGHLIRFIEYMDVGNQNNWSSTQVCTAEQILAQIHAEFPVEEITGKFYGEVARRYRYKDGAGEIGIISSVSKPFCSSCTRLRLSTDGKLFTCLFASSGHDIRRLLRENTDEQTVTEFLRKVWTNRADQYSNQRNSLTAPARAKVEMYQIGG